MNHIPKAAFTQSPKSFLWSILISSHLGPVAAIVVSTLLSHGQLSAKDLCHRTKISLPLVKTCLVSLIQLNCVQYCPQKAMEYAINDVGLLTLLHAGDIIHHITLKYSDKAGEVVQNLLANGHVKVLEYTTTVNEQDKVEMDHVLAILYQDGYIKSVSTNDFIPHHHLWNQMYHETMLATPRNATTSEIKRVLQVKDGTKAKLVDLMEHKPQDLVQTPSGKVINPDAVIGFNYCRYQKHLRTVSFVALCESRLGPVSARVYESILESIESKSPEPDHYLTKIDGLMTEPDEVRAFLASVENKLVDSHATVVNMRTINPPTIDISNSIVEDFAKPKARKAEQSPQSRKKVKLEHGEGIEADGMTTNSTTPPSKETISHHFKLLSSSPIPFITETTPGSYTVPFYHLQSVVKDYTFDELIKKTVGSNCLRILRCIKSLKLVDEKTISNTVLLKDKIVRNEIYKLIQLNTLEAQEIPRSNDRAALKTYFAFRYKANAYDFIANSLVYNMGLILERIHDMKHSHRVLLDKCERQDVKGKEQELLLDSELTTLNQIQAREIYNIGKMNRLKGMYDVFKL